jgi:hypothetical protein
MERPPTQVLPSASNDPMAQPRYAFIAFVVRVSLDQTPQCLGLLATHAGSLGNAKEHLVKATASTSSFCGRFPD